MSQEALEVTPTQDTLTSTFTPTGVGASIFPEKYARHTDETWQEASMRVATAVSAAEQNGKAGHFRERFYREVANGFFMPGGRVWYGAGRKVQQLLNCFVCPSHDSIAGWGKTISDVMSISSRGGGVGVNFSNIRPRGYPIGGMGGEATGSVSLMTGVNGIGDILMGGGGRRMALMFALDVNHPDIMEFLDEKLDLDKLNNCNVSVMIPQDMPTEEFQRMVREDEQIPLMFNGIPDREGRTISAQSLWARLVKNAWQSGEPGVLNGHLANKMNNIWYHKDLICSNPCGEIMLEEYGCCCLGALVLPRFVEDGELDWDRLDESIRLGVRFLDNVLDVNHYPLPEIEDNCREVRRIGLGLMGLHSMLLDLGMQYNSEDAFEFVDRLMKFVRNTAYSASVDLAIEKGPFSAYRPDFLKSGFVKTLPTNLKRRIREHGIRNCALLTVAPTGTTSMVQGVTGGIEPLFSPMYIRRRNVTVKGGKTKVVRTLIVSKEYTDHPDLVQGAYDIPPADHMRMQVLAQKYICNAVSKTVNMPEDYPEEALADLWLEYLPQMKGSTFYRQGSRGSEPMEHVNVALLNDTLADWTEELEYEEAESMECPGGACEIRMPGVENSDSGK